MRLLDRGARPVRARHHVVAPLVVEAGVHEAEVAPGAPRGRCRGSQRVGVARHREGHRAVQRLAQRDLTDEHRRGEARQVAPEQLDAEPTLVRLVDPVLDGGDLAVDHVDLHAVDHEPRATVHERRPLPGREDLAVVAEGTNVGRVEGALVVDAEVPVGVGTIGARRARTTEDDGEDAGDLGEPFRDLEHRASSTGAASGTG